MTRRIVVALLAACMLTGAVGVAPARADRDDWNHHRHYRHERHWRDRHYVRPRGYYYYSEPDYYYYSPPPVYAPPPPPSSFGLNLVFPFHVH